MSSRSIESKFSYWVFLFSFYMSKWNRFFKAFYVRPPKWMTNFDHFFNPLYSLISFTNFISYSFFQIPFLMSGFRKQFHLYLHYLLLRNILRLFPYNSNSSFAIEFHSRCFRLFSLFVVYFWTSFRRISSYFSLHRSFELLLKDNHLNIQVSAFEPGINFAISTHYYFF